MMVNPKLSSRKKELQSCRRCDFRFALSLSKCPSCGQWHIPRTVNDTTDQTVLLSEVSPKPLSRIQTGPWDKCFSQEGGIITTSVTLIGGAPGAGKSTMSLQLADRIAQITDREIIYIGAEESAEEITHRARRLELKYMNKIRLHPMGSSADLGDILTSRKPSAIILDSLPGLTSDQDAAVELCKRFKDYCVLLQAPVIIIDHVTKELELAGLMALQHAVDTLMTLSLVNPPDGVERELCTVKNRFGPQYAIELIMTEKGLILELPNKEDEEDDGEEETEEETE